MIKVVIFFRRRPGMALDAFHEHWRTRHAELIARLPGIRRYVQNYPLEAGAVYDAVAESSFDDTGAMKALSRTPEYAAVLADEPRFIDPASMGSIITEEHVLKDGPAPAGGAKLIAFVAREPGTPIDDFFGRWLEQGAQCARSGAVRRYVQCHTRRSIYDSGRTPAYDGAAMIWLDRAQQAGELGPQGSACLLARERVVAG